MSTYYSPQPCEREVRVADASSCAGISRGCGYRKVVQNGFSLVELIVATGLFTLVMTLAAGAYLLMINANRNAQAVATGINSLSFALETMTYSIRTGRNYNCPGASCQNFAFTNATNQAVSYNLLILPNGQGKIQETRAGVTSDLTDTSVNVSSLRFYAVGTAGPLAGDYQQARVTIVVSGAVSSGPGRTENFNVEAGATMRISDL